MRKIQLISLVVVCLLFVTSTAFAFGQIAYPDRPLNLRSSRSPKAAWIGSLYPGQKVRIAHEQNGWVAVYEPDATDGSEGAAAGYSNVKYLKKTRSRYEPKTWGELVYTSRTLNVRTKPSIKSKKIGSLKAMARVLIDFPDGDWTMVFVPNATIRSQMNAKGYCSAKYFQPVTAAMLTKASKAADAESSAKEVSEVSSGSGQVSGVVVAPPAPVAPTIRRVVMTAKVNMRQSRTSNSPLVRTLKKGDVIQVGLLRNGWYAVFSTNDVIRSESSSLGYALQSLIDESTRSVPIARPISKPVSETVTLEAVKAEALRPEAVAPKLATPEPGVPAPAPKAAPVAQPSASKQQTMIIDRDAFTGAKRPDPTPDKIAHGYKYRLVETAETRKYGEVWITLKVFLATTKVPSREALKDFASTLWMEYRRVTKKVAVLVYLPGMDLDDLAYGVVKFDNDKMLELWVRKATLFGTKFM